VLNTQQVVFPKVPLIRVEGPLAVTQLLETTLLNLINYPSLVATNAARMRLAAGPGKRLLEFGLRRAQGPDGGVSASKYAYIGGFDGTSNVLAGKLSGMAVTGTHAHSFVMSYTSLADLHSTTIVSNAAGQVGENVEFVQRVLEKRTTLGYRTNDGELAAFIAYAQAFPAGLLALVDTYDILSSGVPNFLCVGWVLWELGYKPLGLRIDSGDLAYFSKEIRSVFKEFDRKYAKHEVFGKCNIVASNDINEKVLLSWPPMATRWTHLASVPTSSRARRNPRWAASSSSWKSTSSRASNCRRTSARW
jgi:nicotinate phosphoribosyltransferase